MPNGKDYQTVTVDGMQHRRLQIFDAVLIAAGLVLGLLLIIIGIRHLYAEYRRIRRRQAANIRGLVGREPSVDLAALPKFTYEKIDVKDAGEMPPPPPECPVCLSRVEEGEVVRVLPNCMHIFHVDCIDMWLSSHSTCPVCRTGVVPKLVVAVPVE